MGVVVPWLGYLLGVVVPWLGYWPVFTVLSLVFVIIHNLSELMTGLYNSWLLIYTQLSYIHCLLHLHFSIVLISAFHR